MLQVVYNNLPPSPFKRVEAKPLTDGNHKKVNKKVDVSKNKYIIEMEFEILKTQKNIEREITDRKKKKTIEAIKNVMTQAFTNDKYMVTELKKMKTMDSHNENDLKRAIINIKNINSLYDEYYYS
jgi:hypothetical protein